MNEKMIKISAVFKLQPEDGSSTLVEVTMNYYAAKASENKMSKLDIYESLKDYLEYQVNETIIVLDATEDEVKKHYEVD